MVLIYGGAYQGKLDFAKERYGLADADIICFTTDDDDADNFPPAHKCLYGLHLFILSLVRAGSDPLEKIINKLPSLNGKIIVTDDISCGVVPMGAENRAWREAAGRCAAYLSQNADEVFRLFCGIPTRIK